MQRHIEDTRLFWTNSDGVETGQVFYTKVPDLNMLICEEVFVDPQFRGQSLGGKLLKDFIKYAIETNQKIYPLCPFAEKYFDSHSELSDLSMVEQISKAKAKTLATRKED